MSTIFTRIRIRLSGALTFALCVGLVSTPVQSESLLREPIQPLTLPANLDLGKVHLGRKLFYDPLLSTDGTVSCASCHDLRRGGADHLAKPNGVGGAQGEIRTPTVYNSSLNFVQFWDGRAATLEEQVNGPIENPKEMGAHWDEVLTKLGSDSEYARMFSATYQHPPDAASVRDAIATFERSLVSVNSRFDRYLKGNTFALSSAEKLGYEKFKSYGCIACHQGAGVGGNMYQKMGVMGDYFGDRGHPSGSDLGRFNVTHNPLDKNVFKVPSLRNAALAGPYFHDGSAKTLTEAIRVMAKYQLGRVISEQDVALIVKFLATLPGDQERLPTSEGRRAGQ